MYHYFFSKKKKKKKKKHKSYIKSGFSSCLSEVQHPEHCACEHNTVLNLSGNSLGVRPKGKEKVCLPFWPENWEGQ